jgi:hypothetical protein
MAEERAEANQFVHRFLGGPPLAVLGRLVLLSILRWLWRYFLLGAVIVVPIWLLVRLSKTQRGG